MAAAIVAAAAQRRLPKDLGWRLIFGLGAVMALLILWVRRTLPESPRWLLTHGRADEAERIVSDIEATVLRAGRHARAARARGRAAAASTSASRSASARSARRSCRATRSARRSGLVLMAAQAFTYNAFLFSFGTILTKFFKVPDTNIGLYLLPFALGNFLGPLLLGPPVRHGRAPRHDRRHLPCLGPRSSPSAPPCSMRAASRRLVIDGDLDGGVLLRLRRRERGLPHGLGDLPDGDPRDGDRVLLRRRDGDRRAHRARRCSAGWSTTSTR